jgi:hemerythrin-like domain-containing protein/uncharacterized protein YndB with AHSA1/START domain
MSTTEPAGRPADTSMMRIVHQALRRDLDRAARALGGSEPPGDRQRRAIARHLRWMMAFLHAHHRFEDEALYPVVRERRPDAAELLDTMDRDHRAVAGSIAQVTSAATSYEQDGSDAARRRLMDAIDALRDALYPHLRREEDDVMPIVSACMTHEEWRAIDQEHNLDPKTKKELGIEGHWLIDDADDADRAIVLGLVPPIPRFILLHGLRRAYRRRSDACWRPQRRRRRVQARGDIAIEVDAPLEAVWGVVRDPTRVGEWSHECVGADYLDGADRAEVGVRFRGRNRQGLFRWGRICEIISVEEPHRLVWRTVPTTFTPDSSVWTIELTPTSAGTRIEQRFEVVKAPPILGVLYATVLPAHRDRTAALEGDLRRLGAIARAAGATGRPDGVRSHPSGVTAS